MRCQTLDGEEFARELAAEPPPVVLDVRTAEAYEAGHVPGSRSLPVHEMARRMRELPASRVTRVIVVGDPGRRCEAAATWLALMGFADVACVSDGISAYRGELETGPPPPPRPAGPELRVID